jgi:thiol-disulfide isomerase/thioredoxin
LGSGLIIPLTARVVIDKSRTPKPVLLLPPAFHLEGEIDIAGQKTLVTLPFRFGAVPVDLTNGPIAIDSNGNGTIESGMSRESLWAHDEEIVRRAGDTFVSFESVDLEKRTFTMRERAKDEYKLIEVVVGQPLPDFEFTDFDGKPGRLSDYRGKYVLLDFWGSWCKPCVAELPELKAAHARLSGKGFEILGMDFENDDTADKVRPLLEAKGVTWRNATPESIKDLVEKRFRTTVFPSFILVDPDGFVVETRSSELRGKKLVPTVERLMKQR